MNSLFRNYSTRKTATINDVVIVDAVRTPIGSFQGSLSALSATELGSVAVKSLLARTGVAADSIDEVYMGNVCAAGLGQAPARQAALFAGLKESTVCTTVHKVCSSGLKAVTLAAQTLMLGRQVNLIHNYNEGIYLSMFGFVFFFFSRIQLSRVEWNQCQMFHII